MANVRGLIGELWVYILIDIRDGDLGKRQKRLKQNRENAAQTVVKRGKAIIYIVRMEKRSTYCMYLLATQGTEGLAREMRTPRFVSNHLSSSLTLSIRANAAPRIDRERGPEGETSGCRFSKS